MEIYKSIEQLEIYLTCLLLVSTNLLDNFCREIDCSLCSIMPRNFPSFDKIDSSEAMSNMICNSISFVMHSMAWQIWCKCITFHLCFQNKKQWLIGCSIFVARLLLYIFGTSICTFVSKTRQRIDDSLCKILHNSAAVELI